MSDLICLEHQLSVIEKKPYRERQKRVLYPPKESNRDRLCGIIDTILAEKPKDFEVFLQKLEQQGYRAKRGKHTAVKGKGQKRFIRFQTLGTGYSEEEIKAVLEGKAKHQPYQRTLPKEQPFQLLVDIQGKMAEGKSVGYKKWATKFNLKEMSKTLLFLQEQKISSAEELRECGLLPAFLHRIKKPSLSPPHFLRVRLHSGRSLSGCRASAQAAAPAGGGCENRIPAP